MSRILFKAVIVAIVGAGVLVPVDARNGYDRREDRWEDRRDDRRDDRREAVVAGLVRHEIASDRAEERYRECMRDSRYDEDCARQRYEDEQEARRKGWRTAIVVDAIN